MQDRLRAYRKGNPEVNHKRDPNGLKTILAFNAFYGDLGDRGPRARVNNASPNNGKTVKGPLDARPYKLKDCKVIGAAWAMTNGWLNDSNFINAMGTNGRTNKDIVFGPETRWRYGAFIFHSNYWTDVKDEAVPAMKKKATDVKRSLLGGNPERGLHECIFAKSRNASYPTAGVAGLVAHGHG